MNPHLPAASPAELLQRLGVLAVVQPSVRGDEIFLVMLDDGRAIGFNGHVDLGTGIRTSLAQIVADELDMPLGRVEMVLGDTFWAPDQGTTTASETIQVRSIPLKRAAATARAWLIARGAEALGKPPAELDIVAGQIVSKGGDNRAIDVVQLIAGQTTVLTIDEGAPLKDPAAYSVIGRSAPRVDIPAKATGEWTFVHDVRLPDMLHGRVIRPPYAGRELGAFIGRSLAEVDVDSIAHLPGVVKVVVIHDFVGVVAHREDQAEAAAEALRVTWTRFPDLESLDPPTDAVRANPSKARVLRDDGAVEDALAGATVRRAHTYVWPWQMHGSIGPCCSVAAFEDGKLTVWSGTQTQHHLRSDLAVLLDMDVADVEVIRLETAGTYGRSGMDDVGADAALLARAVGRPVRVQLSRDQEHAWEPKGAAQIMEVDGGLGADGQLAAYDFSSRYPSGPAPMLALLLTRKVEPVADLHTGGDRTAIPPYDYEQVRAVAHDQGPIVRAAFFRGVSAMPNTFAHESFVDEMAEAAGEDPVAFRLRHLKDPRAAELSRAVAERAGWTPRVGPTEEPAGPDVVRGRGFAYAVYVHGPFPGVAAAAAAWVADVEVNKVTGEVAVTKVTVGQDSGLMINPDGVRHQIQGNVVQSTSRVLMEKVSFDEQAVTSRDWGTYPILKFTELPAVDVLMLPKPDQPPLGVGESASVPSAAAIANAVYDATGVRFRELPLTPERVRAGLQAKAGLAPKPAPTRARNWFAGLATGLAAAAAAVVLSPVKPAIATISRPAADAFPAEMIARGREVAAAGNCAGCHTAEGGEVNAGGRGLQTPFGVVHSTNITPDAETGIGAWSYAAFERAMREGVSRDGHRLYPAFPYTAFAKLDDADMQGLYAFLMSEPSVRAKAKPNELSFPFNLRPLLGGWNALFHRPQTFAADPARSELWNRGAYLVEGAGHCAACHSPRNALGAEKSGDAHLAGGVVDGWDAPALGAGSPSPLPWTEQALYDYLRTGASHRHGAAAGPMLEVVEALKPLPDQDIRAMAHYLASRAPSPVSDAAADRQAKALIELGHASQGPLNSVGARIFDGACAVCHANESPDAYGRQTSLALSSNVHGARPDNLIRAVMSGVPAPADGARGAMPAYSRIYTDEQIADLVAYVRRTQAPGKPAWRDVADSVRRIRQEIGGRAAFSPSPPPAGAP